MEATNFTTVLMVPVILGLLAAILGGIFFFLGMRERKNVQAGESKRGRNYIILGGVLVAAGLLTCGMAFAFITLMKIFGG